MRISYYICIFFKYNTRSFARKAIGDGKSRRNSEKKIARVSLFQKNPRVQSSDGWEQIRKKGRFVVGIKNPTGTARETPRRIRRSRECRGIRDGLIKRVQTCGRHNGDSLKKRAWRGTVSASRKYTTRSALDKLTFCGTMKPRHAHSNVVLDTSGPCNDLFVRLCHCRRNTGT